MSPASILRLLGALSVFTTIAVLVRLQMLVRVQRRFSLAPDPPPIAHPPLVSMLVPARNEARSIAACLRSLLAQDHRPLEVLLWDDASSDETLAIARGIAAEDPRLRIYHGDGPEPGFIAKCSALDRLAREAKGDWLLFTDADTIHAPRSVTSGLGNALGHGVEILTATGEGILDSFWEKAWEPLWPSFLFCWLAPDRLNDPRSNKSFGIGQWLLVSRRAYQAIGGHAAVKAEIVEDCALVARARALGIPCRVALSTRLYRVRMYRSLGEIWEGWSKNIAPALRFWGGGPLAAPASAVAFLVIAVLPFLAAAAFAAGLAPGAGALAGYGPALFALTVALGVRLLRRANPSRFWTLPLAGGIAAAILLNSAMRFAFGLPVAWKGRSYPGGAPAAPGDSNTRHRPPP